VEKEDKGTHKIMAFADPNRRGMANTGTNVAYRVTDRGMANTQTNVAHKATNCGSNSTTIRNSNENTTATNHSNTATSIDAEMADTASFV
jgi:hypothetical protein